MYNIQRWEKSWIIILSCRKSAGWVIRRKFAIKPVKKLRWPLWWRRMITTRRLFQCIVANMAIIITCLLDNSWQKFTVLYFYEHFYLEYSLLLRYLGMPESGTAGISFLVSLFWVVVESDGVWWLDFSFNSMLRWDEWFSWWFFRYQMGLLFHLAWQLFWA